MSSIDTDFMPGSGGAARADGAALVSPVLDRKETVVAYGFQYVPRLGAGRAQRPLAERASITSRAGVTVRVFDLAPAASATAHVIEDIYRDIEELREIEAEAESDSDGITSAAILGV